MSEARARSPRIPWHTLLIWLAATAVVLATVVGSVRATSRPVSPPQAAADSAAVKPSAPQATSAERPHPSAQGAASESGDRPRDPKSPELPNKFERAKFAAPTGGSRLAPTYIVNGPSGQTTYRPDTPLSSARARQPAEAMDQSSGASRAPEEGRGAEPTSPAKGTGDPPE